MNISILGCGFGTALAVMLHFAGHNVIAYSKFQNEVDEITRDGEHKRLLPGVIVPPDIRFTSQLSEISGGELVLLAVPSPFAAETIRAAREFINPAAVVVIMSKGFCRHNGEICLLSDAVVREIRNPVVIVTGPCHAEEVGRRMPTTVVAAPARPEFESAALRVQDILQSPVFRVYYTDDGVGVSLGAALKNVVALSCGILEGMGYGDNSRAAVITRGLAEMNRLGLAMGGRHESFLGLAGVGDLVVTCTSAHSRNHRAGILIGQGMPAAEAVARVGTVEGYICAPIAVELAKKYGVSMPIADELYDICYNGSAPAQSLNKLMTRPKRHESE
ncbi:glycerol-3-phosphate dehydrogenase (NAD(P)(+)) [Clostridia bacterium]|nr:glycerol-3-phosphate dehydrogenase (NAD(P)(+)) [Clostridia bacterium]